MKKKILGVILMIVGVLGGLYVGGWLMFIQPIIEVCKAIDAGTLSATIIGIAILKCLFSLCVGIIIGYAGVLGGTALLASSDI